MQQPGPPAAQKPAQAGPNAAQGTQPPASKPSTAPAAPTSKPAGPVKQAEAAPALRRGGGMKRKPVSEKTSIHEKSGRFILQIAHVIPESLAYNKLLEYQRRIDDRIHHARSELKESISVVPEHVKKKLRVYVYNTHSNQGSTDPVNKPPSWALHIYGRLIDPATEASTSAAHQASGAQVPLSPTPSAKGAPFTSHLKRLQVQLDPKQYPGTAGTITWDRLQHAGMHKELLEIRRMGSSDVDVTLRLDMDWQPERYLLGPQLSEALGMQYGTRPQVLAALYTYIKTRKLQDVNAPSTLRLDATLQQVFGTPTMKFTHVDERLRAVLKPMEPYTINYTVKLDGASPTHPVCFDMDFEMPSAGVHERINATFLESVKPGEVEPIDTKLTSIIKKLNEHRRRRAFYLGFAQSPVDFIHALVASQARDLRAIRTASGRTEYEAERRSELFRQKWVEDAVMKHLHKKLGAGHG